jgi:RimJ/RimL family protein N-acetyltransferase
LIEFGNIAHCRRIEEAAELIFNPRCDVCVSRTDKYHKLLGGIIYTNYTGHSIQMHVAAFHPRWMNRDILWVAFDYPFNQLMCEVIFAQVKERNTHALKFDLNIGFTELMRLDDVYKDEQVVLLKMKREECRHLSIKPRALLAGI